MSAPVVLVTGGARRIGACTCRTFHAAGYRVLIHCRGSRESADALADELNQDRTGTAAVMAFDLSDHGGLGEFADRCVNAYDRIDVLVNNASVYVPTPLADLDADSFQTPLAVNLVAPAMLSQLLAFGLDSIINISDVHATRPQADYLAYTTSQAALEQLTRSLALELAPRVRVNGIAPGAILWPESEAEMDEAEQERWLANIPLGRLGSPDDIASAALFLARDATYMTGQTMSVAGGMNRR